MRGPILPNDDGIIDLESASKTCYYPSILKRGMVKNMTDRRAFEGFSQRTIDFMWNLRFNNEKQWFEAHKDEFQRDFLDPMKSLGKEVFEKVSSSFGGRGFIHKVSRIYKDARRVRGGEPYRTNLWFSIECPSEEWTSTTVFWFELAPENWSYG